MNHSRPLAAGALLAILATAIAGVALGVGPPYPPPVEDTAVYDEANLLSPNVEAALEERIDAVEVRSGAEIVIYTEPNTDISEDENFGNARSLLDQWGVGRAGFDDGLVILVAKDPDVGQTRISTFAGAGFLRAYANEDALRAIREGDLVPYARVGDWDAAMLETVDALNSRVTPDATQTLDTLRTLNAVLGLVGAPLVLVLTLGTAWWRWRREGDDPELVDSPSILMAGPPAEMTPPLATVVRSGRATQHSLNTPSSSSPAPGASASRTSTRWHRHAATIRPTRSTIPPSSSTGTPLANRSPSRSRSHGTPSGAWAATTGG
jgi:uncharacterized membrane protein YgcG